MEILIGKKGYQLMFEDYFKSYLDCLNEALKKLDIDQMNELVKMIYNAYQKGKQIFILGNGGSATCASHWVCDFGKGINTKSSKRMKIISLSDNVSILTALGNDISYNHVFKYQLENLAEAGDLVICLSVSGNSQNLVMAVDYCNTIGCDTISITGDYNGTLRNKTKLNITVQSQNYGVVEDIHLIINHILSQYIKNCNLDNDIAI
jgi:D-sedoheptulose 7-phosphate isomerase